MHDKSGGFLDFNNLDSNLDLVITAGSLLPGGACSARGCMAGTSNARYPIEMCWDRQPVLLESGAAREQAVSRRQAGQSWSTL